MSEAREWGRAIVGAALLAGCADEDWTYRPRDAGAARLDGGAVVSDGAVGDRGAMGDVPRDGGTTADAGMTTTGLTVRAQGMATSAAGSLTVGTLRVSETGFEVGERACVETLCAVGGLVP